MLCTKSTIATLCLLLTINTQSHARNGFAAFRRNRRAADCAFTPTSQGTTPLFAAFGQS
nr:MAG TPA: hypothetical protein [Caudoviricetes sp.]